jgi:signal transduction histidine kinase/CheY-like chemotaxis protein
VKKIGPWQKLSRSFGKARWRWLPGVVTAGLVLALFELGVWQQFEYIAYRQLFRLRGEQPLDERIVIVAIDDISIDRLGNFPWPHQRYSELLSKLRTGQPQVVGFTFPLSDSSTDDALLVTEMQQLPVVLADSWNGRELPLVSQSILRAAASGVGHLQGAEDLDGLVRSFPLRYNNQNAFSLEMAKAAQPLPKTQIPKELWINWMSAANHIPTYSFAQVLGSKFDSRILKDKIVLVGVTAQSIDRLGTPFNRYNSANGVHLQATAIDNLLQKRGLLLPSQLQLYSLILLLSPLLSWQLSYCRPSRRLVLILLMSVAWVSLAILGLHFNYLIWVAVPLATIAITGIGVAFSERIYVDSLIDRQIRQLWKAHRIAPIGRDPLDTPAIPLPFAQVAKLSSLAAEFGRAQSAQAAITHSLSMGLLATELDGHIWFCNSVAARWLNTNVDEWVDRCLIPDWLSGEEWIESLRQLRAGEYVAAKEVLRGEQFFTLKLEPLVDWQSLQTEESTKPMQAGISGLLIVIEDITAAKQLQSLVLEVEIQRRQELTKQNIALDKARQLAESAASIKSVFLANMSHEIRTPMNAVVGLTNLLLETPLNSDQEDFVSTIKLSADHLLKIINEILDFSKLESGEMRLESIQFNLNDQVEQVIEILANSAHRKNLHLSYWIAPRTPLLVVGDPTRLNQVLTNLIGNAIKFTHQGGVTIDVRPLASNDQETTVRFTVTDTGIGIASDNQHKLFQSFSQADASTTRQYGGTGLGLAICQRLVNLMGGEIGVESTLEQGSRFWFELSLPTLAVPIELPLPRLQSIPILIVDSWPHRLQALSRVVGQWGMVATGMVATEQFNPMDLPRVALIDWDLGNTYLLIEKLLVLGVPVIVMTTFDRYESASAKLGDRVNYIFKPIKSTRLMALCDELSHPKTPLSISESVATAVKLRPLDIDILLAEDNPINQKVALRQLSKLGYRVDVVNNGEEVLANLAKKPYDLILMDCHMPLLDGYGATMAIRQLPDRRKEIAIIALTASAMQSDLDQALAAGMNDFLSKPVNIEQLQQAIERWLSQRNP